MEKTYDSTTTCKASWIVNKIIWWEKTINNCWYYYRLRLNDWTKDYVIRWIEKNDIWYWTWCENSFYAFSWWQLPKIWDEMYVIAQYNDAWIIEQWKDTFNKFNYLPECPITADWSPSYEEYLWADKCKVSWKIENIERTYTDTCWFNLGIKVKNWENTYIVWWREYFSWKGITLCLWAWDWWFPIDSTDWKISTQINSWDNFYAILNQKNDTILRYWQNEYDNVDSSIPTCSSATNEQLQTFTWGLTENKIKEIMGAVETEIVKTYPDISNKQNTNTTGTNNISSWTTSNTKESTVTKPTTTQTQNVSTQGSKIKQDISIVQSEKEEDNYTNSWTNKNVQTNNELESSTWSIKIENNNTNSWLVQNTELQIKSNETQQNFSPFLFLGGLIILLWVILLTIYKKKISKKQ